MTDVAAHRGALMQLVFGFFPAQVLQVTAQLGLADDLSRGRCTTSELAERTGSDERSLGRLLRALALFGIVDEAPPGEYELTEQGQLLRADAPASIRNLIMLFCGAEVWRTWGDLEHSVRTGEVAWERLFGPPFEYMADHPELAAVFNEAMAEGTRLAAPGVVSASKVERFASLVDVGGGDGTLLAALAAAAPELRGALFDTGVGTQDAGAVLDAAGVADRCEVVVGDFFESVPPGYDAYLLKSVIHDWDDDRAVAILRNCRDAMGDDGALLVVEPVVPERVEPSPELAMMVMSDLNLLVCTGGRERTEAEFRSLLGGGGFSLRSVTPCEGPTNYSVLEATPRSPVT